MKKKNEYYKDVERKKERKKEGKRKWRKLKKKKKERTNENFRKTNGSKWKEKPSVITQKVWQIEKERMTKKKKTLRGKKISRKLKKNKK